MIARLHGRLLERDGVRLVIDAGGVGYELDVTAGVLDAVVAVGELITLFTHLQTREDGQHLFGFASRAEREMFRALIKVNGVGPKLAMALLSAMPLAALASAVAKEDVAMLMRTPGVGRKMAERLVVELRDKLGSLVAVGSVPSAGAVAPAGKRIADDAESALIALGYKPAEASRWVSAVIKEDLAVEDVVRLALRAAAPA